MEEKNVVVSHEKFEYSLIKVIFLKFEYSLIKVIF